MLIFVETCAILLLSCSEFLSVVGDELQLHETVETTYKDHFTDSPFMSSECGKAKSFEAADRANRSVCSCHKMMN